VVSDETTVTGEQPAQLPVVNETTFKIERRTEPFLPGQKAALTMQGPFGGVAWVSVETDEVLDTLLVPVKGNAGRIEVPIKENYAPNATVSIYLVNGIKLQGTVESFDQFVVLLRNTVSQMVYKHAISTVVPSRNVRVSGPDGVVHGGAPAPVAQEEGGEA